MSLIRRMTMDGSSSDSDSSTSSMADSFSTSVGTSNLWFSGWAPTSAPAIFGACIGLFVLAAASRYLEALRTICAPQSSHPLHGAYRPFKLGPECVCAALFVLVSGINFLLMLAVMQYNVWFFVAILLGLGAGELGFGRYCRSRTVPRPATTVAAVYPLMEGEEVK